MNKKLILSALAALLLGYVIGYDRGKGHQKSYDSIVKTCTMSPRMTNAVVDAIEHSSLPFDVQVESMVQLEHNTSCISAYVPTKVVLKDGK